MRPQVKPKLLDGASAKPPLASVLAFVRTPVWDHAEASTLVAFTELREELGVDIEEVNLPPAFDHVHQLHRTIMLTDIACSFGHYDATGRDQLSKQFRIMIDEGRRMLAVDYALAKDLISILNSALDCAFDRYGAIMTLATTGETALGLTSTGDPVFFIIWTYCGVPAITLPLLEGENRLPMGMQLVGRCGNEARLLRTAKWLMRRFGMNASE
jgi:Asp-tRNA(Asn)/Glu-tRNA(Gln) amidotransferase A subunit family amidase